MEARLRLRHDVAPRDHAEGGGGAGRDDGGGGSGSAGRTGSDQEGQEGRGRRREVVEIDRRSRKSRDEIPGHTAQHGVRSARRAGATGGSDVRAEGGGGAE